MAENKHKVALIFNECRQEEKLVYDVLSNMQRSKTAYVTGLIIADLQNKGVDLSNILSTSSICRANIQKDNICINTPSANPESKEKIIKNKPKETSSSVSNSLFGEEKDETKEVNDFDYDSYIKSMANMVENFGS